MYANTQPIDSNRDSRTKWRVAGTQVSGHLLCKRPAQHSDSCIDRQIVDSKADIVRGAQVSGYLLDPVCNNQDERYLLPPWEMADVSLFRQKMYRTHSFQRRLLSTSKKKRRKKGYETNPISRCRHYPLYFHSEGNGDVLKGFPDVTIRGRPSTGDVYLTGVETCGSQDCALCFPAISVERRKSLIECEKLCKERGLETLMLTLTHYHHSTDRTDDSVKRQSLARQHFFNSRVWRKSFKEAGGRHEWKRPAEGWSEAHKNQFKVLREKNPESLNVSGMIYGYEITYGLNGPHPHLHIILIVDPKKATRPFAVTKELREAWADACEAGGLGRPDGKHGMKLSTNSKVAYLAAQKWGWGSEIASSGSKSLKNGNLSSFDLALLSKGNRESIYGKWFIEHYHANKGRHRVAWARYLRALLGMDAEKTDQEIVAPEIEEDDELIYRFAMENDKETMEDRLPRFILGYTEKMRIPIMTGQTQATRGKAKPRRDEWRLVCYHQAVQAVLEVARYRGAEGVKEFLEFLEMLPGRWSGNWTDLGCWDTS